jgi:putative protein-disulfide isomerase
MEITLLEDPACSWCWAFQPVITALEFELLRATARRPLQLRRVMGGLRDCPVVEPSFFARHWQAAAEISGMPFNVEVWDRRPLRTTFEACRAVKAAQAQGQGAADRLLRRIREAFHVEGMRIDERAVLLDLARSEGLDAASLEEHLQNGRAEALFERDRREASHHRFGFPTLLIRKHPTEPPTVLNGLVNYLEVVQSIHRLGLPGQERRRFVDRPEDWDRLFAIHARLTLSEIRMVLRLDGQPLAETLSRNGVRSEGPFYVREPGPAPPGDRSGKAASLEEEAVPGAAGDHAAEII